MSWSLKAIAVVFGAWLGALVALASMPVGAAVVVSGAAAGGLVAALLCRWNETLFPPSRNPPPEGHGDVLLRWSPDPHEGNGDADVHSEYLVTRERFSGPECVQLMIWGWVDWMNDGDGGWCANVGARPVVFELLRRGGSS